MDCTSQKASSEVEVIHKGGRGISPGAAQPLWTMKILLAKKIGFPMLWWQQIND